MLRSDWHQSLIDLALSGLQTDSASLSVQYLELAEMLLAVGHVVAQALVPRWTECLVELSREHWFQQALFGRSTRKPWALARVLCLL